MTILSCPIPDCGFKTEDVDVVGAAAILNVHSHVHTNTSRSNPSANAPKYIRPKILHNATSEDWNAFLRQWETFRSGAGINDATASSQLLECTSAQLGNVVLRAHPKFTSETIAEA